MKRLVVMLLLSTLVAACGGESSDGPELLGRELFHQIVVGGKAGCGSCHPVEAGKDGVGPSLAGVGTAAAGRVGGLTAVDYLRRSITEPDSFVVEGFNAGVMPGGWDLSDEQIESLVEYLLDL
ncbi:MAG TPA: cytochrome c [Acidimicrobiia bacterium]|nr:cytochrome c [Acidimicrobiia bacterium]